MGRVMRCVAGVGAMLACCLRLVSGAASPHGGSRVARFERLVVAGIALVVISASVGLAPGLARGDSPWDGPPASPLLGAHAFEDPAFVHSMAVGLAEHEAEEARRATPDARAERVASREEFRGLDLGSALQLAQDTFPELMRSDLDKLRLLDGDHVAGFESPNVANVVDEQGRRSLIVSTDPLATESDGELKPLDLDLNPTQSGDAYDPQRAAVDVSVPASSSHYLRVGSDGIGLRPADADIRVGALSDGRVFYHAVDADTDFVAAPSRSGAEVMWQLRSADAPEAFGLDVDVSSGMYVRLADPVLGSVGEQGDAEVVAADGAVASVITAPVAVDADGVAVPARFAFDDQGQLVVRVEHRDEDLRYPIMVDPEVHEVWGSSEFSANCGGGASNFQPGVWTYQQWVTPFTPLCGNADGAGNGLFVRSEAMYYGDTAHGQWIWSPPAGSYIMSAWFDGLRHLTEGTHLYSGLYGQAWGSVASTYGDMVYGQYTHTPNSPYNSWAAVVGLWMDGSYTRPHWGLGAVRGVNLRLGDLDPPVVSLASITGGLDTQTRSQWFDDSTAPAQVRVNAVDGGLGLKTVEVVQDVTRTRVGGVVSSCAGYRSSPCSKNWSPTFNLSGPLPEGLYAIQTRAIDIVDNVAYGPYWIQRTDRTPPTIDLSGTLVDHATDGQLGSNPSIYVHAMDGNTLSASTQRSGVRRVQLLLDDTVWGNYQAAESSCDNCDRGLTWTIPASSLNGRHIVSAQAWDYLGHYTIRSFSVTGADTAGPQATLSGPAIDNARRLDAGAWDLDVSAVDASGVASISYVVDGATVETQQLDGCASCTVNAEFTIDTEDLSSGSHSISVAATDRVGNVTTKPVTVSVSSTAAMDSLSSTDAMAGTDYSEPTACSGAPPYISYYAGASVAGYSLTYSVSSCEPPVEAGDPGAHSVSYGYGTCDATVDSCGTPVTITSRPLCEAHAKLYRDETGTELPYTSSTLKGVPAASYNNATTTDLYTGTTTISINSASAATTTAIVNAIRRAPATDVPADGLPLLNWPSASGTTVATTLDAPNTTILNATQVSC